MLTKERLIVYNWLYKTQNKQEQDKRMNVILDIEAFEEIHRGWKRLGYPFDSLVPSYATTLGSSADRPAALAELVGIILNGGVWYPSIKIQSINLAKDTPYETILVHRIQEGKRLLLPEIASKVREALIGTVEKGTARGAYQAFIGDNGIPWVLGGKTGTGDNRYDVYGSDGNLIKSRVTSRAATFVFIIGDRFFGTITAFVPGTEAERYDFTSSLPIHVLKILAPKLMPLIHEEGGDITEAKEVVKPLEDNRPGWHPQKSMVERQKRSHRAQDTL